MVLLLDLRGNYFLHTKLSVQMLFQSDRLSSEQALKPSARLDLSTLSNSAEAGYSYQVVSSDCQGVLDFQMKLASKQ